MDIFEQASKARLRFESPRGLLCTEDLWDLPLQGNEGYSLDGVAVNIHKKLKDSELESFVVKKNKKDTVLQLQMDIVKRVIEVRLDDQAKKEKKALNAEKKKQILGILAEKEEDSLKNKSPKALKEMLDSLDEDD